MGHDRSVAPAAARRPRASRRALLVALVLGGQAGCGAEHAAPAEGTLPRKELLDPQTCGRCHQDHYREWAASMHAFASTDPLFVAMNQRGQEEAHIGNFCVKCHAPMA